MRITLSTAQQSRIPKVLGGCVNDLPSLASYINEAQERLIKAGGETGWWGGWAKVVFQISRADPYIVLPRQFARAINLDVCRTPIKIQNSFFEFLYAGVGLQSRDDLLATQTGRDWCGIFAGFERNNVPTTRTLTPTNQLLRVYYTDARDQGRRVLIGPSKDQNGNYIYSQDGNNPVNGFYLTLAAPFTTSQMIVTDIEGIQKDPSYGDVLIYQVDATTGNQVLLSRYAPYETTPSYRKYFINRLPCGCCCHTAGNNCTCTDPDPFLPVTALVKYEYVPANLSTDFLVIGNIPALKEECLSIRYGEMDSPASVPLSERHHLKAIKLLNDELRHYLGELVPAIGFSPWGTAKLQRPLLAVRTG